MKLALKVPTQYSKIGKVIRNNQNKLGNHVLKSDLKSTINIPEYILVTISREIIALEQRVTCKNCLI